MLLTDFLRHELGATGTHVGCEHGVCGACTVQIDGEPARACLTLAVQADGCAVRTVEGSGAGARRACRRCRRLSAAHHALQCGFCTAGILMSLDTLSARRNPSRRRQSIREYLSGHLCRCTGYVADRPRGARAAAEAAGGDHPVLDLGTSFLASVERDPNALAIVDGDAAH